MDAERPVPHSQAIRSLVQSLFEHGKLRTTLPKAKEVRAFAEKLITLARNDTPLARRRVLAALNDRRLVDCKQEFTGQSVVQKLFDEIAPKFTGRNGGYTRIIRLSDHRIGDGGSLVLLQLVMEDMAPKGTIRRAVGHRRQRYDRRHKFASQVLKKAKSDAPAGKPAASTSPRRCRPGRPRT